MQHVPKLQRNRNLITHPWWLLIGLFATIAIAIADDDARIIQAQAIEFKEIAPFVKMGSAWGDRANGAHGTFGLFPGGASSPPHTHSGAYHGVVISGIMTNPFGNEKNPPKMEAGSYWNVPAGVEHVTACVSVEPCKFYFHAQDAFDFAPTEN